MFLSGLCFENYGLAEYGNEHTAAANAAHISLPKLSDQNVSPI